MAFDRGDIVLVSLDPTLGLELRGMRPALVLSTKAFNQLGDSLVAPISNGGNFARTKGFTVSLMGCGSETQGVILLNKIRMLDLTARRAKKLETVPEDIMDDCLARLSAILQG